MRYLTQTLWIGLTLVAALGLWLLFRPAPPASEPIPAPQIDDTSTGPSTESTVPDVANARHVAYPSSFHRPGEAPIVALERIERLLRHYAQGNNGAMPTGTNREITAALAEPDAYGVAAIPRDHPDVNAEGELTDRWGSAYFFHALASSRMEIRSAGPDRSLYTADDLVFPDPAARQPPPGFRDAVDISP